MESSILLKKNSGFVWYSSDGISIKGYIYLNGRYSDHAAVVGFLKEAGSETELVERVRALNGCFSLVVSTGYGVFAFSDTTRSFPLMYSMKDNRLFISDSSKEIISATGYGEINHEGLVDYLHSGSVFHNETLVEGIYQVCAMHYLKVAGGEAEYIRYRSVYEDRYTLFDEDTAYGRLLEEFREAAVRLTESLEGRTAVVYLSGGVDSRACLMMLGMTGYEKVVCVSYGKESWDEIKKAREVAEFLGYRHIVIRHDRQKWRKTYREKDSIGYIEYSCNLDAITHMESHYVTRQLCEEGIIPVDSIFITGHIGIIANYKFAAKNEYLSSDLVEMLWKYGMKLYSFRGKRKEYYSKRLCTYFGEGRSFSPGEAEFAFENAMYDTVRTKHIINYHRQFEYYGHEWRVPIMDHGIMKTFEFMSPPARDREKTLFKKLVVNETTPGIGPSEEPANFIQKAVRNIGNPIYSIMRPVPFITSGYPGCLLPPFPIRQYRFLRRFYSYCALREIKMLKEWFSRWKQSASKGPFID